MSALTDGLAARFTAHEVRPIEVAAMQEVREKTFLVARRLVELAPESRELSLALTHLEEAVFWANAAIARGAIR